MSNATDVFLIDHGTEQLVDAVRDCDDTHTQKTVAFRAALRCVPALLSVKFETELLFHLRILMRSHLHLFDGREMFDENHHYYRQYMHGPKSNLRDDPISATIAIREACETISFRIAKGRADWLVELALVDAFDAWKQLASRKYKRTPKYNGSYPFDDLEQVLRTEVRRDAASCLKYGAGYMSTQTLWAFTSEDQIPSELQQSDLKKLVGHLQMPDSIWSFWSEWYRRCLYGELHDYDLLRAVDEIDDDIWLDNNSITKLGEQIEQLVAKFETKNAIIILNGYLNASHNRNRLGIGGNNPPEDMQIEPQIVRDTTFIWAAVDDLKAETEKETPDKSAVLRIIETLGRALRAILAWCAQKGDLGVDTLIKWGIPIGGAAVLANPKLVADVIEAAKAWVPFLP